MFKRDKLGNVSYPISTLNTDRAAVDDSASNVPPPAQGTTRADSRPETLGQGEEAREAFLRMMRNWYTEYTRANPNAQPPPPPPIPQPAPVVPQVVEEFRASKDDDPERAEFWLENTIRVFDELSCMSEECLKCAVSLLRDSAYRWWNTPVSVVLRERVSWELFQEEFRKKYISQGVYRP
ncbi:Protein MCM10 [Gossypium australe]|uniref:Protein MCM10 n=1 Tax=Gossypium australe TaxID=47621 RepID=A0A5B6WQ92_9ROSI|nr:Protein MCM10 [Gossypium australe]